MKAVINYLRYSGIWMGIVVNPYHWQWGWLYHDDNCIHLGPIWVRAIISDGRDL